MGDYDEGFSGGYVQNSFGNQEYEQGVHDRHMRDTLRRSQDEMLDNMAKNSSNSSGGSYSGGGYSSGRTRVHLQLPPFKTLLKRLALLFLLFLVYTFLTNYFTGSQNKNPAAVASNQSSTSLHAVNPHKILVYHGNKVGFFVNGVYK
jgi:hypothetical protein